MFNLDDLSVSYILLFSFSITILLLIFNIFYLSQKIYRTSINFNNYSKKRICILPSSKEKTKSIKT
jgi:hypothetical protein